MSKISFDDLPISEELKRAAREMGFEDATEIQAQTIPIILKGQDVIGRSQTGTGKTAAFAVPAVEMTDGEDKENVQVLVVSPTRELAIQSWEVFKKLYKYKSGVKAAVVFGGQPIDKQIKELKRGVNIVIGTPGRIMDHIRRKTLKLGNLKMVVLDEADEMLNMGFREDIESILSKTPEDRQTVFFCATMPREIMAITKMYLKDPKLVEINKKLITLTAIEQYYCEVPQSEKYRALVALLKEIGPHRSVIFCNTQRMVDELCKVLKRHGIQAEGIHGNINQKIRIRIMDNFKSGRTSILVATDVAARGIDAKDVETVINYDIPMNSEDYVHRIGRTGRAGKSGRAYTMACGRAQVMKIRDIERATKSHIVPHELNLEGIESMPHIKARVKIAEKPLINERQQRPDKVNVRKEKVRFNKDRPDSRESFGKLKKSNSAKIVINLGRKQNVAPNHVVAAIAENTSLSGGDIGKITTLPDATVVEIPAGTSEEVVGALKGSKIKGFFVNAKKDGEEFVNNGHTQNKPFHRRTEHGGRGKKIQHQD